MSTTSVWYLCIGHPAWPDPLHKQTAREAADWYDEHVVKHPGIRVVEVVERRTQMLPAEDPESMR